MISLRIWWWLRSTTGSYGRFVVEIAYGKTMIHSIEVVWEILARKEWLKCRHDASPMLDIPGSTPVWAPYMIFSSFLDIKSIYYSLKIYMYYKRNTGGLWYYPDPTMYRELFNRPCCFFFKKMIHRFITVSFWVVDFIPDLCTANMVLLKLLRTYSSLLW